jgi:hypothetical protein
MYMAVQYGPLGRGGGEVMEEEIVEDSDKAGDKIWSLTAII